jgi:hypothetical protein
MGTPEKFLEKKNKNFPLRIESVTIIPFYNTNLKKWGQCHGQRGGQC